MSIDASSAQITSSEIFKESGPMRLSASIDSKQYWMTIHSQYKIPTIELIRIDWSSYQVHTSIGDIAKPINSTINRLN